MWPIGRVIWRPMQPPPPAPPAAAYTGPGDVVSGATGWWGLRAYSNATTGTNAVRLREDSGNTESDFVTLTDGSLDVASIATFKGAANLFVVKLYDQSGNGFDLVQATAANQPGLSLSGLGALPIITASGSQWLVTSSWSLLAQPYTVSLLANATAGSDLRVWGGTGGTISASYDQPGLNKFSVTINAAIDATASDGAWHAIQSVCDAAASFITVDGSDTSGTLGLARNWTTNVSYLADRDPPFIIFTGKTVELGIWPAAFTAGQRQAGTAATSITTNQSVYWGY